MPSKYDCQNGCGLDLSRTTQAAHNPYCPVLMGEVKGKSVKKEVAKREAPIVEVKRITHKQDGAKVRGRPREHEVCRICGRPHHAKGLCITHYVQEREKDVSAI